MDRKKLKSAAHRKLSGGANGNNYLMLFALSFLTFATLALLSLIPVVGALAAIILSGPAALSLASIYYHFSVNRKLPKLEDLMVGFSDANFLRATAAGLIRSAFVAVFSLFLVVPGVIVALIFSPVFYLLVMEPKLSAWQSLQKSNCLMRKHLPDFLLLQLSFLPWHLLAVLTCGILYIWLAPYIEVTNALYFSKLAPAHPSVNIKLSLKLQSKTPQKPKKPTKSVKSPKSPARKTPRRKSSPKR